MEKGFGRDFWLFRFGQLVSVVGDSCGSIALAWWILEKTGSAAVMSSVLAPAMVARIFLLPLFGPLGDRFDRKKLIVVSETWRALLTAALALAAAVGFYRSDALVVLYVLLSIGTALFSAAATGFVPQLVSREKLARAYEQSHAITSVGAILGGVLGGVIVSFIGVKGAFLLDAASFAVAGGAALFIRSRAREASPARKSTAFTRQLSEGFIILRRIPVLFWLCMVAMMLNLVLSPLGVVLPVLAKEGRGLPPWFLGALESSVGAGSVLGAIFLGRIDRFVLRDRIVVSGIALIGLGVALLGWAPSIWLPLLVMFWIGVGGSLANIPISSQISLALPDEYRSRIGSIIGFVCQGVAPLGVALSGVFIAKWGLVTTLVAMGGATLVLCPLLFVIPRFASFFRSSATEAKDYLTLHYPEAFV